MHFFRFISTIGIALLGNASAITLCDQAKDPNAYSDFGFMRILTPGRGPVIFRSDTDFYSNFSISPVSLIYLERLNAAFLNNGIKLVLVPVPTKGMIQEKFLDKNNDLQKNYSVDLSIKNFDNLIDTISKAGITIVNTAQEARKPENIATFYTFRDNHWAPAGAAVTAYAIAKELAKNPDYKSLPKFKYINNQISKIKFIGSHANFATKICHISFPPETIPIYKTSLNPQTGNLLDDSLVPVVLVGSSFSEIPYWNFKGWLKQALQLDIAIYAVDGGGFTTSILNYLYSKDNQENPHIVLWEYPAYESMDDLSFYRQAIPALSTTSVIKEAQSIIIPQNTRRAQLFSYQADLDNMFISLNFSDLSILNFNLITTYMDGHIDSLPIYRSDRIRNKGLFKIEFLPGHGAVKSVDLEMPEAFQDSKFVQVKLLKYY